MRSITRRLFVAAGSWFALMTVAQAQRVSTSAIAGNVLTDNSGNALTDDSGNALTT